MLSNYQKVSVGEEISPVISNFVWRIERLSDVLDSETIDSNCILDNVKPTLKSPLIERPWNTEFYNFLYEFLRGKTTKDLTIRNLNHDGFPIEIKIAESLIDWDKVQKKEFVEKLFSHLKLYLLNHISKKIYRKSSPITNDEGKKYKWKDIFFFASGSYSHYGSYGFKDMYNVVKQKTEGYRIIFRIENIQTFMPTNDDLQNEIGASLMIVKDDVPVSKATYKFTELFEGVTLKEIETIVDKMELIANWSKWKYFEP